MIPAVIYSDVATDKWMTETIANATTDELRKSLAIVERSGWVTFAERLKAEIQARHERNEEVLARLWRGAHQWYLGEMERYRAEDAAEAAA